jgi:hypothetical protein
VSRVELGCKVKDLITGFEGIVTGRTLWLTGCVQFVVVSQELDKDGKRRDGEWFDEQRLKVLEPITPDLAAALAGTQAGDTTAADAPPPGGPREYPRERRGG